MKYTQYKIRPTRTSLKLPEAYAGRSVRFNKYDF